MCSALPEDMKMLVISNTSNSSNSSARVPAWIVYKSEFQVWFAVMLTFCIIGTALNLLLMGVLTSFKQISGCTVLILNFLLACAVQCGTNLPLTISSFYDPSRSTPRFCLLSICTYVTFMYVVEWADLMVGINRFVAICFPLSYPKWNTRGTIVTMVLITWTVSCVMGYYPVFAMADRYKQVPPWNGCGVAASRTPLTTAFSFIGIYCPTMGLGLIYLVVLLVIFRKWVAPWYRTRIGPSKVGEVTEREKLQPRKLQQRYKNLWMLVAGYFWFSLCAMPTSVIPILALQAYSASPILQLSIRTCMLLAYASVPGVYLALNAKYRLQLTKLFRKSNAAVRSEGSRGASRTFSASKKKGTMHLTAVSHKEPTSC